MGWVYWKTSKYIFKTLVWQKIDWIHCGLSYSIFYGCWTVFENDRIKNFSFVNIKTWWYQLHLYINCVLILLSQMDLHKRNISFLSDISHVRYWGFGFGKKNDGYIMMSFKIYWTCFCLIIEHLEKWSWCTRLNSYWNCSWENPKREDLKTSSFIDNYQCISL